MCIACEIAFMDMLEHVSEEERSRILRERNERARFACDAPDDEQPPRFGSMQKPGERKP